MLISLHLHLYRQQAGYDQDFVLYHTGISLFSVNSHHNIEGKERHERY